MKKLIFKVIAVMLLSFVSINMVAKDKPNVLFIIVDDLRPELNCYGATHIVSPNIDNLSSTSVQFNNSYCNIPVCGASRASVFTGLRPAKKRFVTYYSRADEDAVGIPTMNTYFKDNGYYTVSNGKVYHHADDSEDGWNELWDAIPTKEESGWRNYLEAQNIKDELAKSGPAYEGADVADNAYRDGKIAEKSINDLIKLSKSDKPFFLSVGFLKPHLPFNAPKKYWDMYPDESIKLPDNNYRPKNAPDAAFHTWGELRAYKDMPVKGPVTDEQAKKLIQGYYACVSYTDAQVGKVLHALDSLGLSENTIVVLTGDHGYNLSEHTLWCKHCNFKNALQVPLLIRKPGESKSAKTNSLSELVDIYPTLCELTGVEKPTHLQGKSLVPILNDPAEKVKDFVICKYHGGVSVKTEQYSYTEWYNKEDKSYARTLFDHIKDMDENINVAEKAEYKHISDSLQAILQNNYEAYPGK
ncbi:sulfatase [Bacteroidales bacterium]|nr:sulfatase [Bacteroidales bacterium]